MSLLRFLKLRKLRRLSIAVVVCVCICILACNASFFSAAFVIVPPSNHKTLQTDVFNSLTNQQSAHCWRKKPMPMALLATTDDDSNNEEPKPKSKTKSKTKTSSTTFANSLHGRLLCASQCAYSETRDLRGNPYFVGAGFLQGTSLRRLAPRSGLDACLVGRTVDGIVVAFRGTSGNALEWLQNASIYLRKVPTSYAPKGCRVHEGFYGALGGTFENGVKKAILDLLEEERTERYSQGGLDYDQAPTKIYLTGHSKGGSLASLFALMLYNDPKLPSPELVCSFGAARVGNPAFGAYFDTVVNQITYENDLDIIPFLPPGETTMEDMQNAMEDPEAMMDMIER